MNTDGIPLILKYKHPYFKIIFNVRLRFVFTVLTLALIGMFLQKNTLDMRFVQLWYFWLFILPLLLHMIIYSSYLYMVYKVKFISIYNDRIVISGREYKWDEISLNIYSRSYSSPSASMLGFWGFSSKSSIIINKNGKCVEEILFNVDALNLFDLIGEDFYTYLTNVKEEKYIDIQEFNNLKYLYIKNRTKLRKQIIVGFFIVSIPIVFFIIFIKSIG